MADGILGLSDITEKPVAIGNILFLLPAFSLGLVWFYEKSAIYYWGTAVSIMIGIFLVTYSFIDRLHIKSSLPELKKRIGTVKSVAKIYKADTILKGYPVYFILAVLGWVAVLIWGVYETILRIACFPFPILALIQLSAIVYLATIFLLMSNVAKAGTDAVNMVEARKR